jgi:hypothetical protein
VSDCTLSSIPEAFFYFLGLTGWIISFITALIWWKTRDE